MSAKPDTTDAMRPLPIDGPIAPGTPIWGSLFNAASAQLYRWWGILDAPFDVDTRPFWRDLFEADAEVRTPEIQAVSIGTLRSAVSGLHRDDSAHHLALEPGSIRVFLSGGGLIVMRAGFVVHHRAESRVVMTRRAIDATLTIGDEGRPLFRSIVERIEQHRPDGRFEPSYLVNRARATSTRFQAHMDALTGDADPVRDLLMPTLDLRGLIAARRDHSAAGAGYSDVNELRRSVAGSDEVADNVIRDFAGFAAWLATTPDLLAYGLHRLERLTVTPLPDRRYEVVAQYEWIARTANGAPVETHHPLTWIFVETGEAYWRIERLLPFG